MPIRGETIGRAYVRILADGSGFDDDVKRQIRESTDTFQTLGEEHGEAYQKGWEDQIEKGHLDEDFQTRLEAGIGRMHAIGDQYGEHFTEGFRDQLKAEFGDLLGEQIAKNLEDAIQKGSSFQGIADRLENIRPEVARATQQIAAEQDRIWAKQNADNEKDYQLHTDRLARQAEALNEALDQQNADQERDWQNHLNLLADMDEAYNENWRRDIDNNEQIWRQFHVSQDRIARMQAGSDKIHADSLRDVTAQYRTLINDVNKFSEGTNRNRESFRNLNIQINEISDAMAILGATSNDTDETFKRLERTLRSQQGVDRANKKYGTFGATLGKMFGKGARNNFVNAVGSIMEGVGNLASIPSRIIDKFKGLSDSLGLVFDQAGGGVSGFIAVTGKIIPALGAAGFGVIALTGVVGTLTTALLLAAGAAIALASSLGFGLIGAIAPLVGLLGPVGVAAGGVALAFLTMDKATRKATFKPFTDGLKKLGSLALPGIMDGLTGMMDRLRKPQGEGTIKLFQRVEHLATAAGVAVGKFLENFAIGIRGAGLGQFIDTMRTTMPRTMARLGRILGNTFEGFLGVLSTLNQPGGPVDKLLTNLNDLTKGFGTWSVSPQAVKFFNDASDSAGALMDLIRPLWDLLSKILNAGKGAGDNMFSEMGKAVQGWSDALSKRDLKTFFDDAQKMGEAIGRVVVQIGHLINALDDPTTRQFAISLVDAFGKVIEVVATLVGWFGGLNESVQGMSLAFAGLMIAWGPISKLFLSSSIGTFASNLSKAETRMEALGGAAKLAAGAGGLVLLTDGITHADRKLSALEVAAGGAAAGFAVGGPWGAVIGGAGGALIGLGNQFLHAGDKAKDAYAKIKAVSPVDQANENLKDLKDTLDDVTGAYGEATRAGVKLKLQQSGAMEIAHKYGITTREMINGVLNGNGAFKEARPILKDYGDQIDTVKQKQKAMIDEAMGAQFGPATRADARKMLLGGFGDANEAFTALETQRKALQARRIELEKLPGSLQKFAGQIQRNARDVQDLTGKLNGIPKNIRPKIIDSGILPTTRGVANIARRYKLLDGKKIKTLIQASGADATVKQVQRVIKKLNEADKKKTEPKIDVDTKKAEAKVKGVLSKLGIVGKFLSQPSVLLDITKFDQKNSDVKQKVNETGKLNPQIKVDAQTQQASTDLTGIQQQVNNLPPSKTITITVNTVHRGGGNGPATASGGMFWGAQNRLIGESGPEAVVPLSRPLYMVDPAVRELAAFARGQVSANNHNGRSVTTGPITIVTPTKDPIAVAQQVVNRIAAASYI